MRLDFAAIRDRTDLRQLLRDAGHQIPEGRPRALIRCPFHDDQRPSCQVSARRFKCYACGQEGSVLDFVRLSHRLGTLREAAELIAGRDPGFMQRPPVPKLPSMPSLAGVEALPKLERLQVYFTSHFDQAWEYLRSRGLANERLAREAGVGFAPARRRTDKDGRTVSFPDRVIFPIWHRSFLVNFHGRAVEPDAAPRYRQLFRARPMSLFAAGDVLGPRVGLMEGQIDALSLAEAGLPSLATCGAARTDTLTAFLEASPWFAPEEVVLVRDNDAKILACGCTAGLNFARKAQEVLQKARPGTALSLLPPPQEIKDANDWLLKDRAGLEESVRRCLRHPAEHPLQGER